MKGANLRASVRISFEEAIFGTEKELEMTLKDECTHCHGTGAKEGTTPVTCPKCNGSGQVVYTQQSMFGMVRNVQPCPDCGGKGTIIKDKCPHCYGTGYTQSRKKIKGGRFLPVSTMARAFVSVERASQARTAASAAICW